jgi:hypothetical protein
LDIQKELERLGKEDTADVERLAARKAEDLSGDKKVLALQKEKIKLSAELNDGAKKGILSTGEQAARAEKLLDIDKQIKEIQDAEGKAAARAEAKDTKAEEKTDKEAAKAAAKTEAEKIKEAVKGMDIAFKDRETALKEEMKKMNSTMSKVEGHLKGKFTNQ